MKVILTLCCITLPLTYAFAGARVSKMSYADLPLWFMTSRVAQFVFLGIARLGWPILISGIVWSLLVLQWWIVLIIIVVSWILADTIVENMPPMLAVLLTPLPSLLLSVIIWFMREI